MIGLKRGIVSLVEHDESWSTWFAKEQDRLASVLGERIGPFEHVGSTAIPGIPAKPVIDFMAGVASITDARALVPLLEPQGYAYRPNGDRPERILLVLGPEERRLAHFSLVVRDSVEWCNILHFRDYLRAHSEARSEYAELKRHLARQFPNDRASYTKAKESFIQRIIAKAVEEQRQ